MEENNGVKKTLHQFSKRCKKKNKINNKNLKLIIKKDLQTQMGRHKKPSFEKLQLYK